MTEEEILKINPNIDDEKTIQQLPGIGPVLAKKMVDARPFSGVEDLQKIRGIRKSVVEQITPMLVFSETGERADVDKEQRIPKPDEIAMKAAEVQVESTFPSPNGESQADLKPSQPMEEKNEEVETILEEVVEEKSERKSLSPKTTSPRLVKAFSRTETLWIVIGVGVLSLILSVLLSMAILGGINGTLNFNRLQGLQQLESDMGVLEQDLQNLTAGLEGFEARLTPLEGLTGRMTTVEDLTETLQGDVEEALGTVEMMQSELEDLSTETARLSGRVSMFDDFLDGLHTLINELFAEPSGDTPPES